MNSFKTGWYVMYTRPNHEKKISVGLSEMKIDYFLPTVKKLRTWHDRRKFIDMPLFPSYIFVYLKDLYGYFDGLKLDGAISYVKTGKEIARVHETVINSIRVAVDNGDDVEVSDNYLTPGQQLVIKQGPLTGLTCEVVHFNNKTKILVRVHLLQRNILVTLPSHYLMPAVKCSLDRTPG
jgi:transcriptional antiterminator RfaH